jgi:hypothetical protein
MSSVSELLSCGSHQPRRTRAQTEGALSAVTSEDAADWEHWEHCVHL